MKCFKCESELEEGSYEPYDTIKECPKCGEFNSVRGEDNV